MRLTVQSDGGPYGRVSWQATEYVTSRPSETATLTTLYLTRTQGSAGQLRIFYRYLVAHCHKAQFPLLHGSY